MQENIYTLNNQVLLTKLSQTPYPPKRLYVRGTIAQGTGGGQAEGPPTTYKFITIVGSRSCSDYAKQVTDDICRALIGQNISIISGLAQGIDTQAHKSALKHNLHTIAVLGCGLGENVLRQHHNYRLAHKILDSGGALMSEYSEHKTSRPYMFPARNRIMVGLSDLVIVIEAKEKSGTRITARLATDYNRDLLVVPNSIYSSHAKGSNELIKQGAYVYTTPEDIYNLLKLDFKENKIQAYTPTKSEKIILDSITLGQNKTQPIIESCSTQFTTSEIIQMLLNLEIEEVIKRVDGVYVIL